MSDRSLDGLLTAAGAARELSRLGVDLSEASIKRAADRGDLPVTRTEDRGMRLFRISDIRTFAKSRRVEAVGR